MSPEQRVVELRASVGKVSATIQAVPDDALADSIDMPWGPQTLEEICAYPYWNMLYQTGQINYIASILGFLD